MTARVVGLRERARVAAEKFDQKTLRLEVLTKEEEALTHEMDELAAAKRQLETDANLLESTLEQKGMVAVGVAAAKEEEDDVEGKEQSRVSSTPSENIDEVGTSSCSVAWTCRTAHR